MKPGDFVVRLKGEKVLRVQSMMGDALEVVGLDGWISHRSHVDCVRPATDSEIVTAVLAEIARVDTRLDDLRTEARAAFERALKAGRT